MCYEYEALDNNNLIINNKKPLIFAIIGIFIMCVTGIVVTAIQVKKYEVFLYIIWALLGIAASMNQGYLCHKTWTAVLDVVCAFCIVGFYGFIYYCNLLWWHYLSLVLAFSLFSVWCVMEWCGYTKNMNVNTYVLLVNIWHAWVIFQTVSIPYTIDVC